MKHSAEEHLDLAMGMLQSSATIAFENVKPVAELEYLVNAAKSRLAEATAMLALAAGRAQIFDKRLTPLISAVDDFTGAIEKRINKPIEGEDMSESDLQEILIDREYAMQNLDQARIAGCAMLLHLSAAMRSTNG